MAATLTHTRNLVWDLTRERPTLGGALVLRQEGEILARLDTEQPIILRLRCHESDHAAVGRLAEAVFGSSIFSFRLIHGGHVVDGWPLASLRAHPGFSYFSFERLIALHQETGFAPRLNWEKQQQTLARQARAQFSGRLVCIHLRSVSPFTAEESNADGSTWDSFFVRHARQGTQDFLLLGDDPLPAGLTLRPGVSRAVTLGLDLAAQLALIGCADGFLGMASGVSAAANLSETPHVIFKHPAHHPAEMARELGTADRFPFAGPRQRLWRRAPDAGALDEALALISP